MDGRSGVVGRAVCEMRKADRWLSLWSMREIIGVDEREKKKILIFRGRKEIKD